LKFALISAGPNAELGERESKKSIASFPPLGLLYLGAVLKNRGVRVSVLDQAARGLTNDETVEWIKKEDPEVVGFSTFASSGQTAGLISSRVKHINPNIIVVLGNQYATFNPERILNKYPTVDIIGRGEGEGTIIELADCIERDGDLRQVRGIAFRHEGRIFVTPERPLIKDLDSIPFPDRSMLTDEYHCFMAGTNVAPKKFTSLVSSRGCVYDCRFCSCTQFARNRWRHRSVENTLEELRMLADEGYEQLIFVDDSFTTNQKRIIELCKKMRKEKIEMDYICEGRVNSCSYDLFREMAVSGCRILYFGIESGNQRILDYYNKKTTVEQNEAAVRTAKKAGIDVIVGSFIVGAPDETRTEIQNTIDFASRVPLDLPQFNILGVHPGNALWDEFESTGVLEGTDYWETGVAVSQICPTAVPLDEIKRMIHEGFYRFVLRPEYLLRQVNKTAKSGYRLKVFADNFRNVRNIRNSIRAIA
jgi:anaerobic magnesium-protoporphyrin IX monomethyl ester cyclase